MKPSPNVDRTHGRLNSLARLGHTQDLANSVAYVWVWLERTSTQMSLAIAIEYL